MNFKDKLKKIEFDLSFLVLPIAVFIITTTSKILWLLFSFLGALLVLFLLKKYNITKALSSKYISLWIDRIFFLCLTFTPVISMYCLFSKHMKEVTASIVGKGAFFWHFSDKRLISIFILVALMLYIIEKILHFSESNFLRNSIQLLARYTPLFIGICLF